MLETLFNTVRLGFVHTKDGQCSNLIKVYLKIYCLYLTKPVMQPEKKEHKIV